ncbi:bifunctional methylenetetrahydrofolate dehydrogenase/methenyltetrahydrofolate cyclohydrolase FolD [Candidatus Paracaedibacter symbiosus]|uniref:bifunctional methylenetetrahydrofolate dehydrogenase/methenyltetrahydrofolate cyclohydrolase FolD n=1 Tax=Candidatus Paracaedibacter symbiosus TaxID=244582 RepID=UPI000509762D|nr:bifunctional methylenetetrahydrofolate dehydrogenase/methenyltetrahydrofolate cyclohydrolase FolD [Candidatus Paracaedibacter symbiosus]
MVELIDGKKIAALTREQAATRAHAFTQSQGRAPGLAVILVGHNPASEIYVNRKIEACHQAGITSFLHSFEADMSEEMLQQTLQHLNGNVTVDGILLQLPLPAHLDAHKAVSTILPRKDVDGLHPYNQGLLNQGRPLFSPCTPQGCIQLLQSCCDSIAGANVVIIGRSILVGRPLAAMLTNLDATVTLAHSHTKKLAHICAAADILISAVGKPQFLTADYVKPGAIVLDVGINRLQLAEGKTRLVGDVDFDSVAPKVSFITPVPGGVGPMTIANLLLNTVKAAELSV